MNDIDKYTRNHKLDSDVPMEHSSSKSLDDENLIYHIDINIYTLNHK
jgi:hypothetical protein